MNSDETSVEIAEPNTNDEVVGKPEIATDSADTDFATDGAI